MNTPITFEQPLSEQIRVCLRFEQLFSQLHHQLQCATFHNSQSAVEVISYIVGLADRPDLKSKLLQNLTQQRHRLRQFEQASQVSHPINHRKLQELLHQLDCLIDALHHSGPSKLAENLRQTPFLKNLRQQLTHNTMGSCSTSPAYFLWLHQPAELREKALREWVTSLQLLEELAAMTLYLARHSAEMRTVYAENGFYQQALNPQTPCQMVRVTLPIELGVYPQISVGRHRLSIRFKALESEMPLQLEFPFELSCCLSIDRAKAQ